MADRCDIEYNGCASGRVDRMGLALRRHPRRPVSTDQKFGAQTLTTGAMVGFAFAAGFVAADMTAQPSGSELTLGLGLALIVIGLLLVQLSRSVVQMRHQLNGALFEIVALNRNLDVLRQEFEAELCRESGNGVGDKLMGLVTTISGRPCTTLDDGSMVVETLLGHRRFTSAADARAFIGQGSM